MKATSSSNLTVIVKDKADLLIQTEDTDSQFCSLLYLKVSFYCFQLAGSVIAYITIVTDAGTSDSHFCHVYKEIIKNYTQQAKVIQTRHLAPRTELTNEHEGEMLTILHS